MVKARKGRIKKVQGSRVYDKSQLRTQAEKLFGKKSANIWEGNARKKYVNEFIDFLED